MLILASRLEQFAGEVRRRAVAGRCEIDLARARLGERDQLRHRVGGHRGIDHQDVGLGADQADRDEILLGVVVQLLVERGVGGEDAVVAHQQRVAVGSGTGDLLGGDVAAGAGPVLDDEGLVQDVLKPPADDARQHVARPARREGDQQRDRPVRIGALLRVGRRRTPRPARRTIARYMEVLFSTFTLQKFRRRRFIVTRTVFKSAACFRAHSTTSPTLRRRPPRRCR